MVRLLSRAILSGAMLAVQIEAITVNDILVNTPEKTVLSPAVQTVREAEPYTRAWVGDWQFEIPRDSVQKNLRLALRQIDACGRSPEAILLKALCWHYLYQLEVKAGFHLADSLATQVMRSNPALPQAAWLKGVNLIRAGRLKKGFAILDSLQTGVLPENGELLLEYARLSACSFLPAQRIGGDSIIELRGGRSRLLEAAPSNGEAIPVSYSWKVNRSMKDERCPSFLFSESFNLSPTVSFPLPLLQPRSSPPFTAAAKSLCARHTLQSPVEDPFGRRRSMDLRIMVSYQPLDTRLDEFVGRMILDRFDAVRRSDDLPKLKAISLRCVNRSVFRGTPGQYCAFVAFDIKLPRSRIDGYFTPKSSAPAPEPLSVRYLLTMQSSQDVQLKAERILQEILSGFESYLN
jgi:hypothetical protein